MSILKRIWDLIRGKSHKALDAIENPIEQAELTIRDLEAAHGKSITALAKSKSIVYKLKEEAKKAEENAKAYLTKATKLKAKLADDMENDAAELLKKDIILMLNRHENFKKDAEAKMAQAKIQGDKTDKMAANIKKLQTTITTTKADISSKKANLEMSQQNKAINKELSNLNVDGIQSKLEGIQSRIDDNNNEAEAWVGIEEDLESDEARIERMLNENSETDDNALLNNFLNEGASEAKPETPTPA
jgi:phage shock protein A